MKQKHKANATQKQKMTVKKCMESSEASAGEAARLESGHDCSVQSETALYNMAIIVI